MLNILVCVKQVPDINLVKMDPVTGSLIRAGVPAILNPLDANALEAAVRVKEAHGGTVTVITMGPDMAKEALRECLAAGADRAVLLSDRAFANADTLATSYVIASAAKLLGAFDLIFCGKESLDGATGQMGSQLAERFGASQISSTAKIVEVDTAAHTITAERDLERGTEVLRAKYPCLLTVEKANFRPHPEPEALEGLAHRAHCGLQRGHHPGARLRADRRPRLAHESAAHLPAGGRREGQHDRRGQHGKERGPALRSDRGRALRRCRQ